MSFGISKERLKQLIKEELVIYLLESEKKEYSEIEYAIAAQDAKDRGEEEFEFPPGSGEMHTTNELEEGESFSGFNPSVSGVTSTSGVTRTCGPNLSCSPGM